MSKALDYLLQKRPDAMGAYFTFLKQAGTHLDKKTAALISVITKVHAKTAKGLRQYLPRALKAGASADEVIDALLFAMPALGFSKIVWAVDVILEMNLHEFQHLGAAPQAVAWRELGDASLLKENEAQFYKSGSSAYYALQSGAELSVYSAECPHQKNVIPLTGAHGLELTCPFHEWKFDLKSGQCISGGPKPLRRIEAKLDAGKIWIRG
ncbi:MAG: Rieske 2Fe-2S domain-containing protein [Turneriella sp.]|nr:Rieske 2Fe-2S domain-containing protein [Turneriella sp.]